MIVGLHANNCSIYHFAIYFSYLRWENDHIFNSLCFTTDINFFASFSFPSVAKCSNYRRFISYFPVVCLFYISYIVHESWKWTPSPVPTTNDYWSHVNSHNMTNGNGKYFEYPWSINKNVEITWVNDFNAHSITFDNEVNVSVWVDYPINTLHMSSRASKLLCAWCVWSHATITDDDANLPFNNEDDELISIRLTILHLNDLFTEKISVPSVEPFTYRRLSQQT